MLARTVLIVGCAVLAGAASPALLAAGSLTFVPLAQPCRAIDTRVSQGGVGPLTAAHGNYKFGTSDADIESIGQNGTSTGCGIPANAVALSALINQLDATAAGNVRMWSTDAGTTGPSAGTAVYNPSVAVPSRGQVVYNGAAVFVPVGATDQRFYFSVANGQIDITLNVVGYWIASGATSYTFTLTNANFSWSSSYVYSLGVNSYSDYATRYHVVSIPAITQQVLDAGSVQVFFNPDPTANTNHWEPLPYRWDTGLGYSFVFAAQTSPGQVELDFFTEQYNSSTTPPDLSTFQIPTKKFKVVVTPATETTAITP